MRLTNFKIDILCAVAVAFLASAALAALSSQAAEPVATGTETAVKIEQGDLLKIIVYREADLSGDFVVDTSGNISFPLVGVIKAEKRPVESIRQEILNALKKYIIDPQITITHEKKKKAAGENVALSESFTVLGEVRNPGTYEAEKDMTLTKALAEAGGMTMTADAKKVKIIRSEEGKQTVKFYGVDQINNAEIEDPGIRAGDKIVVNPEEKDTNTVAILGEVKMAGMYEVTPGFTLMKLIARAGGFTPLAASGKVRVVREESGQKKIFVYNAGAIIGGSEDDPAVKPGDMVFVPESFF